MTREATSTRAIAFRLSLFYGTLFLTIGLLVPYWPMWLEGRGMDAIEISLLIAVSYITRTIANPVIGALVDRRAERRRAMLALAAVSLCAYGLFLLAEGFWPLVALTVLSAAAFTPIAPLGDSLTLLTSAEIRLDYGRIRLWGSLTFIIASTLGGAVLARHSADTLVWLVIATLVVVIGVCTMLPDVQPARPAGAAPPRERMLRRLLANRVFLLFLATTSLIHISHLVYYGFGALHWQAAGISLDMVGMLWAEGVLAEIILFATSAAILRRMSPVCLIMLAGLAGVLRWAVLGLTTEPVVLAVVQALHAFTFGACHIGAMHFLDRAVPRSASAGAQAMYASVATGLLPGAAMLFVGRLYSSLAGAAFFAAAAVALIAAILAMVLERCWSGVALTQPSSSQTR